MKKIDISIVPSESGGTYPNILVNLVEVHPIHTLNVAGPRASKWKEGYAYMLAVIKQVIVRGLEHGTHGS